jgi:hypothetical protein
VGNFGEQVWGTSVSVVIVTEHRQQAHNALTLTGLAVQIDQLRNALDAVAANVRRHEEELRKITRSRNNK